MKQITGLLLLIFLLNFTIKSQHKLSATDEKFLEHKNLGDKYNKDDEFYLAAQEYLKAAKLKPNDPYVDFMLAECYRKNFDYDDAEKWYEKVYNMHNVKYPYAQFWVGMMQKTNGKYVEAEKTFDAFIKTFKPVTQEDKIKYKEAEFEYRGCIYALDQMSKPIKDFGFKLLPPPVNSKNTDYAPMLFFHDSSIVMTSSRADAKGTEMNLATGEARSDNFRFEKVGEKWLPHHNEDNFQVINTTKDDGPGELTKDKNKYYYSICDPECGIFVSKKVKGKFTKPVKLNKNINYPDYWNAQPTLSPTSDTMFFVSKRPGGEGAHDIWMSINKDKTGATEDWGPAINMSNINTPYVELSPFWDDHTNTIYFASNGHEGFGGLDIYVATGQKRDSIVNIGLPFNSNRDDFYFVLGKDRGYLVSNRKGGIGLEDIYTFNTKAKESVVGSIPKESFADAQSITCIGTMVFNDVQAPVSNVSVFLKDEEGNIVKEAKTNQNGEFRFDNLPPDKQFSITMVENDPRITTTVDYKVQKKTPVATATKTAAAKTGTKLKTEATTVTKNAVKNNNTIAATKTPVEKTAANNLVENNAEAVAVESANAVNTANNSSAVNNNAVSETEEVTTTAKAATAPVPVKKRNYNANVVSGNKSNISVSNFQIKSSNRKPNRALFENVYFDFNSIELNEPSKKVLDNLLRYYGDHKEIQIEIKAYTDGLGDTEYNKDLAAQRGQACYDYLVGRGVDQTALLIIPAGATNHLGSNNSFIGRQLNRRVEFSIIGAKDGYEPEGMAYVVEPRMTLFSIAKKFNMSVEELKQMNGIGSAELKAYSTIRVKRNGEGGIISSDTKETLNAGKQEYKFVESQFIPIESATAGSTRTTSFSTSNGSIYIVQPQETLFSIAKKNGLSVEQLKSLNNIEDNSIYVGQKLKIK